MKILYLAPHLSTGGMPQFLLKRIESLIDVKGVELYVVEYECYSLDYVVQRNKIKSSLKENFTTIYENKMELFDVIDKFKPDVIHVDDMVERLDREMVKRLYSNDRKYRIVETFHGVDCLPKDKIFKSDLYLYCTPYHVDVFKVDNYKVIEYPIDKQEINAERTGNHVLNVGLWTPGKNQAEGIEIARKYPNFIFHFIGNQAVNFKDYWEPLMKDLPKNVKVWGERKDIDNFMRMADIFMFNSTWECNPLVLREAISYNLPIIAHNLPQYGNMFTDYIQPIDTDLNTISPNYVTPNDNNTPHFATKHYIAYRNLLCDPVVQQEVSITQYFVNQPFLEINCAVEEDFLVQFFDENGSTYHENTIKSNSWVKLNRQWFTKWRTKVTCRDTIIYDNILNLSDKRVLIVIESDSLGDNLAWMPYCLEFQKKHNCKVIVSTSRTDLFDYPELEIIGRGKEVDNIHGQYTLGWFYDSDKEPELCNTIPLQKAATNILGLEFKEIRPILKYEAGEHPFNGEKYVTIATNSTSECKFWTKEGWQELIHRLIHQGYKVVNVSIEPNPFVGAEQIINHDIKETMKLIHHSEFFIGLGSGVSWLAWALKKKVVMIANFSEEGHEFTLDTIRVTNKSVCHGCWNNKNFKFDKGDWFWCPILKGYPNQFECQKSITADMVMDKLTKTYIPASAI
jgi:autotransporter strand-loop-strand O-heptosyltransferase